MMIPLTFVSIFFGLNSQNFQEMAVALEEMHVEPLSKNLVAMSVYDVSKITKCITLLATEVGGSKMRGNTRDTPLLFKLVERKNVHWDGWPKED